MEVLVDIDVIQHQARTGERRELRTDLRFQLPAHRGEGEIAEAVDGNMRLSMRPDRSARAGMSSGASIAWPSARTRCSPTRKPGKPRARRTASAAAGAATIRLAAVRMPVRLARSTASLTASCSPKSSAVTIRNFCIGGSAGPIHRG